MSWAPPPPWFDERCPNCVLPEHLCVLHTEMMNEIRRIDSIVLQFLTIVLLLGLGALAIFAVTVVL